MTTTLITGANKGLGYETARQLIAAGHTVYVGSRDPERGRQAADELGARAVQLDITNDESVEAAAKLIADEAGGLDVLVNNAGIAGPLKTAAELTADDFQQVFDTNLFGHVRVLHTFLPLLAASSTGVIVNVSSGLGSVAAATDPQTREAAVPGWISAPVYAASKSALNMITAQYAHQFPNLRINAVDPGYTATDLNGHSGPQTVEEGAEIIVRLATITPEGPSGQYLSLIGVVPW